jgi:hypothetical protein
MNRNLVGSTYGRFCIKFPQSRMKGERHQNETSNLYRGPSIDASYQVSYHLAKGLQRKSCFRNRPIRNKNCPMEGSVLSFLKAE